MSNKLNVAKKQGMAKKYSDAFEAMQENNS